MMFTSKLIERTDNRKPSVEDMQRKLFESQVENDPMISMLRSTSAPRKTRERCTSNVISKTPSQIFRPPEVLRVAPSRPKTQEKERHEPASDFKDYQARPVEKISNQRPSQRINQTLDDEATAEVVHAQRNVHFIQQPPKQHVEASEPHGAFRNLSREHSASQNRMPNWRYHPNSESVEPGMQADTSYHRIDPSQYGRTQSFSSKAPKKPILIMNLDVGQGKSSKIFIFGDTEPWQKAYDFVEANNLPEDMVEPIAELIEQNKVKALENLTRNTAKTYKDNDTFSDVLSEKPPRREMQLTQTWAHDTPSDRKGNIFMGLPQNGWNAPVQNNTMLPVSSNHIAMISHPDRRNPVENFRGLPPLGPAPPQSKLPIPGRIATNIGSARGMEMSSNYRSTPHIKRSSVDFTDHHSHRKDTSAEGISLNYGGYNVGQRQILDSRLSVENPSREGTLGSLARNAKANDSVEMEEASKYYLKPNGAKPELKSQFYHPAHSEVQIPLEAAEQQMLKRLFDRIDIDMKGNIKSYEVNLSPLTREVKICLIEALSSIEGEGQDTGFLSITFEGFCKALRDSGKLGPLKQLLKS